MPEDVPSRPEGAGPQGADPQEPVPVASFPHLAQAELACGFLGDAGLPAAVQGEAAGQIQYGKGFSSAPRLLVRRGDLERARTILRELGYEAELEVAETRD